ncbi:MAG: enoyl-CoA hydratase [Bdellovibrionales bacterium RIFOXYB1_FULL_37_110]|nr:MAG: enoyl-CoA hydratase [Bdellovibrionales bacterium RIFOXYA1_FULL_38_20]OFZ51013.1 MAG: enoyl-CoA hydratase [Bdellovibrionales bacterium RIFOXYC1_FULL_37_79]OFZ60225.1 MAG: enoyl-CoA hydratase [Bdellovibrionales bacterium RIFOXYB1_FULL_37_110]OFZ61587.1 MAG: enoyl-CoA hydratase [Bdellovibrionales bacterium RIFOXYD1_FULL_36_51]
MSDLFNFHKDERGVAFITLNRPEIHNAFNDDLIKGLTNIFKDMDGDSSVRLVVLSGNGKSFCAGADLNWMKSMVHYSEEENFKDSQNLANLFFTINNFKKPVIGKINGAALGGGCGLVSVCDFVITHSKAKFGFTEVKLGLLPATISPFVIAKIGQSHARALFMSGHIFKAKHAKKIGLVHKVVEPDELDEKTDEAITHFLQAGPLAAMASKALIKNVLIKEGHDLIEYTCLEIARLRVSPEGQEGMNALLEKRKPSWI